MNTSSLSGARAFAVRIEYFSGDQAFAVENFVLSLGERDDINAMTRGLAAESVYSNTLIPDLICVATIKPVPPEDPGRPPKAPNPIMPKCRHCGHTDITRDATARWDADTQEWYLSATYDSQTCENCGAESNSLAVWIPVPSDA